MIFNRSASCRPKVRRRPTGSVLAVTEPTPVDTADQEATVATPIGDFQYKNVVLVLYILSLFVQIMDSTAVNVAVPTLADHFGVLDTDIDWAIIGYTLSLAAFLPTAGWLADRFGAKRVFIAALAGFIISSMLCGFAASLPQLIGFRLMKGASAGVITPVASAILYSAFPLAERARASTVIVGVVVIAPAIGPIVGGGLVEFLSWRWIFFINLPMGLTALVLSLRYMRELPRKEAGPFDGLGFVLAFVGMAALLFSVSEGPARGWASPVIIATLVAGLVGVIGLVFWERRQQFPLLDVRLLRDRLFRSCNLIAFPAYLGFMGLIFIMPLYLNGLRGFSALETGMLMAPQPVGVLVGSQIVGRFAYKRIGPRRVLVGAMIAAFFVSGLFGFLSIDTAPIVIIVLMFFRGLFLAALFISLQTAIYAQISIPSMPQATTVFGLVRQAAPAFGVALAATWIATRAGDRPVGRALTSTEAENVLSAYQGAFFVMAAPFLVAAALSWFVHDEDAAATRAAA